MTVGKYYVKAEKLKKLERIFRADIREIKKRGITFDMSVPPRVFGDKFVAEHDGTCSTCIVGAHAICRNLRATDNVVEVAAQNLRVDSEWLSELFVTFAGDSPEDAYYPSAMKLAHRLQAYAKQIGA